MPVTKVITLYKFDELDEKAQELAINGLQNINVDIDWWGSTYECAKLIGLEIQGFCLNYGTVKGKLNEYLLDVCKSIREIYGRDHRIFRAATAYHKQYIAVFIEWHKIQTQQADPSASHWKPKDWLADFKREDEAQEIEADFTKALLEDYLIILRDEYEYQTSREQIVESIKANDYLFTELGELA